ncbi:RagB/SusD family nutrient uptake outer membrane protein [Tenacibaculum maritimum]|uniref:RagB/SusD family nutrient uptake outer membrane protein n=1 Tax=Tenacibaculum maritimum TaxID=107401 RepID=UPI002307B353|nr:RagB/SusD family nutrient uptake outer membrane protein [Tenacibaculum maritimum]MDB0601538.1 RagB/SusD family nutrient uptake outer membrane protein [Tenacibaculum maritimum]MDB0612913.1 RagB/SusD family nutrient uptake outer membrane protein [Tenacibaculum maritimum]
MKKNKIIYILLGILSIFVSSCESSLDIAPEGSLTGGVVLSNAALAEGVLVGAYGRMRNDAAFNGTTQLTQEWMSDNIDFKGSFPTFQEIRDYTTIADNGSVSGYWRNLYDVISPANFLINKLPTTDIPDLSEAERERIIAEAKFIRAITNFNLVNLFAQPFQVSNGSNLGIPLIVDFFEGDLSLFQLPRSTVNEVHAAIEKDLLEAIPELLEVTSRGRASKGAAKALLARLYLYRDEFSKAADYANQVIQSSRYELAPNYLFFNQNDSSEHIFQIINNAVDGQTSGQGFSGLANPAPVGRGDTPFSQNLLNEYALEPGDLRFTTLHVEGTDAVGKTSTFTTKFPDGVNNSDNAPILRVTEMYTIRAEANLRGLTNIGDSPLNDINALRSRAGLPVLVSVNLDVILNEKRKELCFEGQRRMDLLRNKRSLRRAGQANIAASAFGANKTILPIPSDELDLNPNNTQNPGY